MNHFDQQTRTTWILYGAFGIGLIVCIVSIALGISNLQYRSLLFFGAFGLVILVVGMRSYFVKKP